MKKKILAMVSLAAVVVALTAGSAAHAASVQITEFKASSYQIKAGEGVTISWNSSNGRNASLYPIGNVPLSGTITVMPQRSTTYQLIVRNYTSYTSQRLTVNVSQSMQLNFSASKNSIVQGESTRLSWSSNADFVQITPNVGQFGPSGEVDVLPAATTSYQIIAKKNSAWTSRHVIVTVQPATAIPAITSPGRPSATMLAGRCTGGLVPQVVLYWNPTPDQTANSVQKRVKGGDWTWLLMDPQPFSQYSYVDTNISPNTVYEYRVKTDYLVASNVVMVMVTDATCK